MNTPKKGILLVNLGTPKKASRLAVANYLREFLADKYVIDLPAIARYILLWGIILPFRTSKSTQAYQEIWDERGSPLLYHSQDLADTVQQVIGEDTQVELAMRYGQPNIKSALKALGDCSDITVLPLYPQFAQATTTSSIEAVKVSQRKLQQEQPLHFIEDFYHHPAFIEAQAAQIKPYLETHDFILFSYHGLPERQLNKLGCRPICTPTCPSKGFIKNCYRAQCYQTTRALANKLELPENQYQSSFQSRLGKTPWIQPYTDETLETLAQKGIKKIAVTCPSFVADCLETLEEIAMQGQEDWVKHGGETLTLIPALNSSPQWVNAVIKIVNHG